MDKTLNRILLDIYAKLLARFGPQHWWPAQEPFEVIVGAILTQSTAWNNVEKAIANLKAAGKLSPESLRRLPEAQLATLIHACGYYNVKAHKLKAFVNWFGEQYDDSLENMFSGDIGSIRSQLLGIYGIGEETADSIILYAGNKPVFVIDAYTRRIIARLGLSLWKNRYAAYQALFSDNLPHNVSLFNEYHALLVKLGKEHCRKKPVCQGCCLNTGKKGSKNAPFPCTINRSQKNRV